MLLDKNDIISTENFSLDALISCRKPGVLLFCRHCHISSRNVMGGVNISTEKVLTERPCGFSIAHVKYGYRGDD